MELDLKLLGDPSGRQDAGYWNDWFQIVCREGNHREFEWYSSVDEVLRVVSSQIRDSSRNIESDEATSPEQLWYIHPGSGTSLLPLKLCSEYPDSHHVVVDISDVAIDEMRHHYSKLCSNQSPDLVNHRHVEFFVMDMLKQQLPFDSCTFDYWIDKGFVDALFSIENEVIDKDKSKSLFREALRVLKKETGLALIVTLAEEHSLTIILDNFYDSELNRFWKNTLQIWELNPLSGDKQSFCFALTKSTTEEARNENILLYWYGLDSSVNEFFLSKIDARELIFDLVKKSRSRYCDSLSNRLTPKLLATLEIKPIEPDLNLELLSERIRATQWRQEVSHNLIELLWHPVSDEQPTAFHRIVPVGYGINKLILQCVIISDNLEPLVELISEWSSEELPDPIQSVDIDWSKTTPVANLSELVDSLSIK
jgi:translation elongation factor EF-1beta